MVSESLFPYCPATLSCCLQSMWQRVAGERHGAMNSFSMLCLLCMLLPSLHCRLSLAMGLAEEASSSWDSHCHFVVQFPMPAAHSEACEPCICKCSGYDFIGTHDLDTIYSTLNGRYFKKTEEGKLIQTSQTLRQDDYFQKETSQRSQRKDFDGLGRSVIRVLG